MILLDKVVEFNDEKLVAEMTVRDDGLFGKHKSVPSWVGIEYMAQAIGAYAGIKSILAGEPIRLGYLLGTRRYSSNVSDFIVGTALTVIVKVIIQDEKLGAFDCQILGNGIEVSANLTVFQPPETVY
jgi:predicted hotdog family 3-hydroxylacyl-ACP dehydratase